MDVREKTLSAALAASERTRRVLVLLQTYALLLVVVYLNASGSTGYQERLDLALDGRDLYACDTLPDFVVKLGKTQTGEGALVAHVAEDRRDESAKLWSKVCAKKVGMPKERAIAVAGWIFWRRLTNRELQQEIDRIEADIHANVYNVPIPLTGLKIDINTFSLVGSAGHFLLLAWLL